MRAKHTSEIIAAPRTTESHAVDLINSESYSSLLAEGKIKTVCSLVGSSLPGSKAPERIEDHPDVIAHRRLLAEIRRHRIPEFVFFSSGGAIYGSGVDRFSETDSPVPISSYGLIKLTIEHDIQVQSRETGLKYLILRPSNPYGSFHRSLIQGLINVTLTKIKNREPMVVWGDGSVVRDYIHVRDLAMCVAELILKNRSNDIFNILTGVGYSVNSVMTMIREVTGPFQVSHTLGRNTDVSCCVLDNEKLIAHIPPRFIPVHEGIRTVWDEIMKGKTTS